MPTAILVCGATRVLARQRATKRVKESIAARGLKLHAFTGAELKGWAEVYVQDHYWELMAWVSTVVEEWRKEKAA